MVEFEEIDFEHNIIKSWCKENLNSNGYRYDIINDKVYLRYYSKDYNFYPVYTYIFPFQWFLDNQGDDIPDYIIFGNECLYIPDSIAKRLEETAMDIDGGICYKISKINFPNLIRIINRETIWDRHGNKWYKKPYDSLNFQE